MPLVLSGQSIETPAGDSGTYTWADVVALGSTLLTQHTNASGRTFFRWNGILTLRGTATLNITRQTIECLRTSDANLGGFRCEDSAVINFGQVATVSGQTVYRFGCQLIFTCVSANTGDNSAQLNYRNGNRAATASKINLYATSIQVQIQNSGSPRCNLFVSSLIDSSVVANDPAPLSGAPDQKGTFIYLQEGANLLRSRSEFCSVELTDGYPNTASAFSEYRASQPYSAVASFATAARPQISLDAVAPTYWFFGHRHGALDFIDSPSVDLGLSLIYWVTGVTSANLRKRYTHRLRITSGGNAVQNALVTYSGDTNASATSDSSGNLTAFILTGERTNLDGMGYTGGGSYTSFYPVPLAVVNTVSYTREIRSYLHAPLTESISVAAPLGTAANPFTIALLSDAGVTQANTTTVGAYAGVAHTSSATTITASRTLAEVYDSRKLHWRNNGGLFPQQVATFADFGAIDLVVGSGGTITGVSKFADGIRSTGALTLLNASSLSGVRLTKTAGQVTLQATGNYSAVAAELSGSASVRVTSGGTTTLTGWVGDGSTQITVASGTATVIVSNASQWVAGTGVTIQEPQVSLTAANFADGTRVQVSRVESYTVTQAAISTSADRVTLAGHQFRSGFFPTLVRFTAASGATLPTSTPQVENGGLYYVVNVSGDNVQLSETLNGVAIDFTNAGSGSFTFVGETELDNRAVSGGSGYSVALSQGNGTLLRVKARPWTASAAGRFFDQTFVWSSTAGVTIPDALNTSTTPDRIHNAIINADYIVGPDGTQFTTTNDGSSVTGLSMEADGTVEIDINDPDGRILLPDAYCWFVWMSSTQAGIRLISGDNFIAEDLFNYVLNRVKLESVSSVPVQVIGGYLRSGDGSQLITTASNPLHLNAFEKGVAIATSTSGSALTIEDIEALGLAKRTDVINAGIIARR